MALSGCGVCDRNVEFIFFLSATVHIDSGTKNGGRVGVLWVGCMSRSV